MLWNWITYHARQRPTALAVILSGQGVTYAKFAADIVRATEDLRLRLPPAASLVGVGIGHSYLHWLALLALARLKIASVSVIDPGDVTAARPDVLLVDRPVEAPGMPVIEADGAWAKGGSDPAARVIRDPEADFPMRMIVSSGTTGAPKRVMLSAALIEQRAFHNTICYGFTTHSRANVQMGEGTTGGFSVPLGAWHAGGAAVLASDPLFNDRVPAAAKPDFVMLSSANLDALLAKTTSDVEAFPNTRFIIGGSPLPQAVLERARRRLSRATGIVYGSTEAGLIALDFEERTPFVPQAAGYVTPLTEVEIVDDADQPVAALTQGHVRVRSPGLPDGYFEDPETSKAMFRHGWFYPGDLGVFSQQGLLVITGRSADTFNFGGVKIAPVSIEEVALGVPGVVDAGACALRDETGQLAVIAVKVADGYELAALTQALQARFGRFRIAIAEVDYVPRNRMGKIERQILAEIIIQRRADLP